MKKLAILLSIIIITFPKVSIGQLTGDINGSVLNSENDTPIVGANVLVEGTFLGAATDENGDFVIPNVPVGEYTISAGVIGYGVKKLKISVMPDKTFLSFSLTPIILPGEKVLITASRAISGKTPIAFSNIDSKTLSEKYSSQELPLLLNEVPSLYSYSMTGNGMGYSEIKIRGFDPTRVAVTLNNVPLNDPEDHVTYFYDIADLSANVRDVQVQRGVGNSLYGTAAIGGSVNIQTKGLGVEPGMNFSGTWGDYNTRRLNFSYGTGIVNNNYSAYGRFSKVETDGYRRDSGVDAWSYFLSGTRYDKDMSTTVNIFGGPLVAKFAWFGITKDELADEKSRRANYYSPADHNGFFENQVDDFLQSHYQILNDYKASDELRIENTLFHIKGDGFFQDYKSSGNPFQYNLNDKNPSDLVRKQIVDKSQWGWLPRVTLTKENWSLSVGGEFSFFNSDHWGEVVWTKESNQSLPDNRYYGYKADKSSSTVYAHGVYGLNELTELMLDFQFQHLRNHFDQEVVGAFQNNYEYNLNYTFLSPRIGINRILNDELSIFVNFSIAKREPRDADIYDADNPFILPLFRVNADNSLDFDTPLVTEETLYDYELGSTWRTSTAYLKTNLFWMDFRNEIVPTGQVDEIGLPVYFNADKSIHRGIEFDASMNFSAGYYLSGNFSLNDNYFVSYNEVGNFFSDDRFPIDRSGNKIGGFPSYLGGFKFGQRKKQFSSSVYVRFVGKQYLDNSESDDLSINSYRVTDFSVNYDFSGTDSKIPLSLQLNVNNLFNRKYETHGAVDSGIGFFIPAALRNAYLTLVIKL
ncbi:MAG: TonB-dependent receptor [Candidatus Marinimicrobia bacterium]|nr:TonB-dependent receptor [Candidatus Neomarinimicrobiota bacterium]